MPIYCQEIALLFWDDGGDRNWKNVPSRFRDVARGIRIHYTHHFQRRWKYDEPRLIHFCNMATAAILAKEPQPNFLMSSLESVFVASLTYHCLETNDDDRCEEIPRMFMDGEKYFFDDMHLLQWIRTPFFSRDSPTVDASPFTSSLLYPSLMKALHTILMKKVRSTISGTYDDENNETTYESILEWALGDVEPWMLDFLYQIPNDDVVALDHLGSYITDEILQPLIADCFWSVRLEEVFDIVTSYPESLPAVLELKNVLNILMWRDYPKVGGTSAQEPTERRMQELSQSLRDSFVRRLNHPGADTTQLIDVYIAAIQVLRQLLDSGPVSPNQMHTFIAYTTEPVRSYLRHYRKDTVRCILTSLTNHNNPTATNSGVQNGNEGNAHVLYQELRRQDTKPLEYMALNSEDDADDEDEECPTLEWQPRPSIHSYAHHQQQQQRYHRSSSISNNKEADILAMLVGIYGSKELFVNEYRSMLADKMLNNLEFNTDNDVHTLELLKLRFGEMSLINAEVMIKDIEDSARLNKNIRDALFAKIASNETVSGVVADAAVVSHIFWPKLPNGPLKHHPRIQVILDEYATMYAEQKNPRTLHWLFHLGSVQMELDVWEESPDGLSSTMETKEFTCSPFLATLISHFEDEPTWSVNQLSNETNVPDHIIIKQMSFWIKQRIVTQTTSTATGGSPVSGKYGTSTQMVYTLTSKAVQSRDDVQQSNTVTMDDYHHEDDTINSYQQLAKTLVASEKFDLNRYASYVLLMLTNLQNASIQQIHEMLSVMSSQSDASEYNLSLAEVHSLLQNLCRQRKVECGLDGMYKLVTVSKY